MWLEKMDIDIAQLEKMDTDHYSFVAKTLAMIFCSQTDGYYTLFRKQTEDYCSFLEKTEIDTWLETLSLTVSDQKSWTMTLWNWKIRILTYVDYNEEHSSSLAKAA